MPLMSENIFLPLYMDEDILVIEKKKAFLSQKSDQGSQEALHEFIQRTLDIRLYPVHRLDREVLGIMVYGRTSLAAERLSEAFRERTVLKVYWAWVHGTVAEEAVTLIHYLKKNQKTNFTTVYPRPTPGAKEAILEYRKVSCQTGASLLEVQLKTGRSHQIRAQLAKAGHPLIGDLRYDRGLSELQRARFSDIEIQLRSKRLGLPHPRSKEWMEWEIDLPSDKFFN